MKISDYLKAAKAKIADPKCWTQGMPARDDKDQGVSPRNPTAVCWCSTGALESVVCVDPSFVREFETKTSQWILSGSYLTRAAKELGCESTVRLNDETDHALVMKMFDRAVELAEKENSMKLTAKLTAEARQELVREHLKTSGLVDCYSSGSCEVCHNKDSVNLSFHTEQRNTFCMECSQELIHILEDIIR